MSQKNAGADDLVSRYGPWCLVAGASTGIGKSFSEQLANKGFNLVMLALPGSGLSELADGLADRYAVQTQIIELDLAAADLVDTIAPITGELDIGLLIYVACHSVIGEFTSTPLNDKLKIIDVNVKGPIRLISHLTPFLEKREKSGIILMSSMSGWQGTAMVSTYAASKAFTTNLAEGLWTELAPKGIDVLALVAGATHTPTFDRLTPVNKQQSVFPMQADEVVREALANLGRKPTHIAGWLNRLIGFMTNRVLSRKVAVRFISANTERVYFK